MRAVCLLLLMTTACAEPVEPATVRWIAVFASDYDLELEPPFDPDVHDYTALADGPDIEVFVEVVVTGDIEPVQVNGVDSEPAGFRTWHSPQAGDFISPTSLQVQIDLGDGPERYDIDVTVP